VVLPEPRPMLAEVLQTQQRQAHVDGEKHANDRAHGVRRIDSANTALAPALTQERVRDEWQGHASAERRRQHDGQRDAVARQIELEIADVGLRQHRHQPAHDVERGAVQVQRGEDTQAYSDLDPPEPVRRLADRVDPAADPETAAGQPDDEGAQHELEGVCGAAEHETQHADPADLVDERRRPGEERDEPEQSVVRLV